jgi:hypothetical protein
MATVHAITAATIFFLPHANTFIFANAYTLHYQEVNIATLYVYSGLLAITWWIVPKMSNKVRLWLSFKTAIIYTILMAVSYWARGNKAIFYTAYVFISFDLCVATTTAI